MATKTKTALNLTCPHCNGDEQDIRVRLNDLGGAGELYCQECDAEFTAVEAAELLEAMAARYRKLAAWIEAAPTL